MCRFNDIFCNIYQQINYLWILYFWTCFCGNVTTKVRIFIYWKLICMKSRSLFVCFSGHWKCVLRGNNLCSNVKTQRKRTFTSSLRCCGIHKGGDILPFMIHFVLSNVCKSVEVSSVWYSFFANVTSYHKYLSSA